MSYRLIPDDVEKFILDNIDSVAQLEALLILRGNPEKEWSTEALANRLYISETQTAELLARLSAGGFLSTAANSTSVYRYQPNSSELQQVVDRVAEIYAKQLVPVTELIHSKPRTRVQEFADAFRLRKDK